MCVSINWLRLPALIVMGGMPAFLLAGFEEWRSVDGRTVSARILGEDNGRILIEREADRRQMEVLAEHFHPEDLKRIRELAAKASLEEVYDDHEAINQLLGIDLLPKRGSLWELRAEELASQWGLSAQSRHSSLNSYALPGGKRMEILGETCHSIRLFSEDDQPERLTFIFDNRAEREYRGEPLEDLERVLRGIGSRMEERIRDQMGRGIVRSGFRGGGFTEHGRRWDHGDVAFQLAVSEAYIALRVMPTSVADDAGRAERVTASALREWTRGNVEKGSNGDVVIRNIPMTDQGRYGFCLPATFERYLRYMRIPADMHLIALHSDASAVRGTSLHRLVETTGAYLQANRRRMREDRFDFMSREFKQVLQEGRPLVWTMYSSLSFNQAASEYTSARRRGDQAKLHRLRAEKEILRQDGGNHVLMVTGFNEKTEELRISDSWGPDYEERWIPLEWAQSVHLGPFMYIDY